MEIYQNNSSLALDFRTMEKLWYDGKNYGTMDKTQWFYTENNGTSIYEGKKHGRLPKIK